MPRASGNRIGVERVLAGQSRRLAASQHAGTRQKRCWSRVRVRRENRRGGPCICPRRKVQVSSSYAATLHVPFQLSILCRPMILPFSAISITR